MIDLVPSFRGLLKASDYFVTTLAGFKDSQNRFKVFREAEAPSTDSPYVTIELQPIVQDQRTGWLDIVAIFHVTGKDTEWTDLWNTAGAIRDIAQANTTLPAVGDTEALTYQMIGKAKFSDGRNPVTDEVTVSVAIGFGIEI